MHFCRGRWGEPEHRAETVPDTGRTCSTCEVHSEKPHPELLLAMIFPFVLCSLLVSHTNGKFKWSVSLPVVKEDIPKQTKWSRTKGNSDCVWISSAAHNSIYWFKLILQVGHMCSVLFDYFTAIQLFLFIPLQVTTAARGLLLVQEFFILFCFSSSLLHLMIVRCYDMYIYF